MSSTETKNSRQLLAEDHEALDALLRALITGFDQDDSASTFARLDLFWARLAMHIRAENLHLFPSILGAVDANLGVQENKMLDPVEARDAINGLRRDHDFFMRELGKAVNIMRDFLASNKLNAIDQPARVREIINQVAERLKSHNEVEEEIVYALPAKLLSATERSDLAAGVRRELAKLPARFTTGRK